MSQSEELIRRYYEAFNAQDWEGLLALLADDVRHDINEGTPEIGKDAFRAFLQVMDEHYDETVMNLVVMSSADGTRLAAEFGIEGRYKKTQAGLPEAQGQSYRLPVGAFFEVHDGRIGRVTTYYNLRAWIAQVSR